MFTLVSRGKGEEGRARMVGGWETKGGGSLAKPKARLPVVCTKMKGSFKELNQITTSPGALFPQPLQGKHFTATHRGGRGTPSCSKDETPPPSLGAKPLTPQPCLLRLPPLNLAPLGAFLPITPASHHSSLLLQPKNSLIALLIVFFPSTQIIP